jgi:hypothetical protein
MGVEATPLDDLAAVVKKHSSSWVEDFAERKEDMQRSMLCLQKVQDHSPWNGVREVLEIYPFFKEIWKTASPKLCLDPEGYTCKLETGGVGSFHGTEEKWQRHNWKILLTSLDRVVALCQRYEKEARVLINLIHRVRGTSELPPTDQDPFEEAQQLLDRIRFRRAPVILEPFSPETLERLEREEAARRAKRSRKARDWSLNFDQTLERLRVTIPQERERVHQILMANLGSDEAISQCLENAKCFMTPYARPTPPEEG